MRKNVQSKENTADGNFVFQGTVTRLAAATMNEVPVSTSTVVVRVDRLLQAPEALSDYTGHEITVKLSDGQSVTVGESSIFHTNGWIFGESIAVQCVRLEPASPQAMSMLSSHPDDHVKSMNSRNSKTQANTADLIVSGHVSSVRLSEGESFARANAVAAGGTTERISEHTPLWQEAVVSVDAVHKGKLQSKQVVIHFPSSTDVRWRNSPKFQTGQEGVFLLHKSQLAGAPAARAALALAADEYTSLNAADFQPIEELPHLL